MKVFISWSGDRSRQVAEALGDWLKKVVQSVEPWVSTDMQRGVKWLAEVNKNLDEHSFGILSITPENVGAPWLNYEAGALAKHLGEQGRVIPYLLGYQSASDLKEPLAQFNASLADQEGTWQLVLTLNKHAEFKLEEGALSETFEVWWPKLHARLAEIIVASPHASARRSNDDKIDEVLAIVRGLQRTRTGFVDTSPLNSLIGRAKEDYTSSNRIAFLRDLILTNAERVLGPDKSRDVEIVSGRDDEVIVIVTDVDEYKRNLVVFDAIAKEAAKALGIGKITFRLQNGDHA